MENLVVNNIIKIENTFWGIGNTRICDVLFCMDAITWEIKFTSIVPRGGHIPLRYSQMLQCYGKICLIPRRYDYLDIYDIKEKKWSSIKIEFIKKNHNLPYKSFFKFASAYEWKRQLYLLPNEYPAIAKYSFETEKIEYIYINIEQIQYKKEHEKNSLSKKYFFSGKNADFFCCKANAMMRLDIESYKIKVLEKFNDQCMGTKITVFDGTSYWLIPSNGENKVIKWDRTGKYENIICDSKTDIYEKDAFQHAIYAEKKIFLFPGTANYVVYIDLNSYLMDYFYKDDSLMNYSNKRIFKYNFADLIGDNVFAFNAITNELVSYNIKNNLIRKKKIQIDSLTNTKIEIGQLLWLANNERNF